MPSKPRGKRKDAKKERYFWMTSKGETHAFAVTEREYEEHAKKQDLEKALRFKADNKNPKDFGKILNNCMIMISDLKSFSEKPKEGELATAIFYPNQTRTVYLGVIKGGKFRPALVTNTHSEHNVFTKFDPRGYKALEKNHQITLCRAEFSDKFRPEERLLIKSASAYSKKNW